MKNIALVLLVSFNSKTQKLHNLWQRPTRGH